MKPLWRFNPLNETLHDVYSQVADLKKRRAWLANREHHQIRLEFIQMKFPVKLLKENLLTEQQGLHFMLNDYKFEPFNARVQKLFEAGIIQWWIERELESTRRFMSEPESGPKVLRLQELSIGFEVWLTFLAVSAAAFAIEIGYVWLKVLWRRYQERLESIQNLNNQLLLNMSFPR
jgi:hypothetical protein